MKRKRITIEVNDNTPLYYGKKLYLVAVRPRSSGSERKFREKCPVCGATKKITVKGFEFACPMCCGTYTKAGDGASLTLYKYEVMDCYVHSVSIIGQTVKAAYSADGMSQDGNLPMVKWSAFCKYGQSFQDVTTFVIGKIMLWSCTAPNTGQAICLRHKIKAW